MPTCVDSVAVRSERMRSGVCRRLHCTIDFARPPRKAPDATAVATPAGKRAKGEEETPPKAAAVAGQDRRVSSYMPGLCCAMVYTLRVIITCHVGALR